MFSRLSRAERGMALLEMAGFKNYIMILFQADVDNATY
jgi:hypothetical protein